MTRGLLAVTTLLATTWLSAPARADAPRDHQVNALSYEPFALLSRGIVLQYERLVLPRWSVVGGLGARLGARDDFESETWLGKGELRWWLASAARRRGMTGWYLGYESVAARTSLASRRYDREIGAYWQVEESLHIGHRWRVLGIQEITPSVGLGMIHEFDERGLLAPITRGALSFNLTIGWLFADPR